MPIVFGLFDRAGRNFWLHYEGRWVEAITVAERTPEVMRCAFSLLKMGRQGLERLVDCGRFPEGAFVMRKSGVRIPSPAPDAPTIPSAASGLMCRTTTADVVNRRGAASRGNSGWQISPPSRDREAGISALKHKEASGLEFLRHGDAR